MTEALKNGANLIKNSKKTAVLTGAGVSAESGVPTFRGKDGLWKKFRPEELATHRAFKSNPTLVWEWYGYRQKLVGECNPNPAHEVLAEIERMIPDFTLITQNVDGLHRRAGSRNILELHGNLFKARCTRHKAVFDFTLGDEALPLCKDCGGILRPHIVWFGEGLDENIINKAFEKASACDVFMVIGTSGLVQPAASLPFIARDSGAGIIEINLEKTPLSPCADLFLQGSAGEIMHQIWKLINQ